MNILYVFFALLISSFSYGLSIDLEETTHSFVLETKRIHIPNHPHAFNPSIIRWKGKLIMSFRELNKTALPPVNFQDCKLITDLCDISASDVYIPQAHATTILTPVSSIGLIELDDDFNPIGNAYILTLTQNTPSRADDGRLIIVNDKLYLTYFNNTNQVFSEGGYRPHIIELDYVDGHFSIRHQQRISHFEGEKSWRREKNWVPFDYEGNLFMAYRIPVHRIFHLEPYKNACETIATTHPRLQWQWGDLRGGTPALKIDNDRYLSFFHSCMKMSTIHSDHQFILHYFMGAYTFASKPPFDITHISPSPIIAKNFYRGDSYTPHWKPVQVVFPCGLIIDDTYLWMSYGRQDHEVWIAKIDKAMLLQSLVPVSASN